MSCSQVWNTGRIDGFCILEPLQYYGVYAVAQAQAWVGTGLAIRYCFCLSAHIAACFRLSNDDNVNHRRLYSHPIATWL